MNSTETVRALRASDHFRSAIYSLRTATLAALVFGSVLFSNTFAAQVSIAWDDNSLDETGFKIERATAGGAFVQIATVGANVVTYVDTTTVVGTEYSYRVSATNDAGTSSYSNTVTNAPTITTQPTATQNVNAFTPVSFSVVATSFAPLTYQWRFNGSTIPGATGATYTINSATAANVGNYTVDVSNGVLVTSNPAALSIQKVNQTITFGTLEGKTFGDAPFSLSATSSSGLGVTFSVFSGPATIAGNTITITGTGTVVVRASQAGDGNYNAATPVDQSLAVSKASQSITFGSLSNRTFGDAPFTVNASASSSLPVAFSVASGPATAAGNSITITGAGSVVVRAAQTGNANYNAANVVDQTFTVAKATPSLAWAKPSAITYLTPLSGTQLNATSSVPGTFVYSRGAGTVLNAGADQLITTTFSPTDSANYNVASASVSLSVNKATPAVTVAPTAATIAFGQALTASTLAGGTASTLGTFTFSSPSTVPTAVGSYAASVIFTPTDLANFDPVSLNVNLTINKGTPSITNQPISGAINVGQALSVAALTGGAASVPGTFAFTSPSTIPSTPGTFSAGVTFTPTDFASYNTITSTVNVTVNRIVPVISVPPSATSLNIGQALSSSTLNGGIASVLGSFAYTSPAIVPSVPGVYAAGVTFTPTDTTNYLPVSTTVNVVINKLTPSSITAPTASNISLGQTLASSVLTGGGASVPGAFAFTSPTTIPSIPGVYAAGVTFTPTDTTNYLPVSTTVSVVVNKLTPSITTAPTASNITLGQTLASSVLTGGGASVPGTFAFTSSVIVPSIPGVYAAGVTFTPSDTANYSSVPTTVNVLVNKLTPSIITTPSASNISLGQTLASSVLTGGGASVPGTFVFTSPATTLPVGDAQTVGVTFVPTDTANHNSVSAVVTINVTSATVEKITPSITTAPSASSITAGQRLGSSNLSGGVASVPGTFTFSSPDTVLAIGNGQTVAITFVPADTNAYNTVGGTTAINVAPASTTPKTTPVITAVPLAAAITVGQSLSSSQLSGGSATTSGTFAFATPNAIPSAGSNQSVAIVFNPTDTEKFESASGTTSITVNKLSQIVSFTPPTGTILVTQPVALTATASSGLPVTFAIVNGNATISGNSLTIFTTGAVTVRASQEGNATFAAATADLTLSNIVSSTPAQVYFGSLGSDPFAASISPDGKTGKLVVLISASGEPLIVDLTINPDGTFTATAQATTTVPTSAAQERSVAGAAPSRTFRGRLINGVLSGNVDELGLSFAGNVQPATGSTSTLAGLYTASATGSASGTTYMVIGTQGQAYALVTSGTSASAGTGTVTSSGSFQIKTSATTTLTGTADVATTGVTGTIQNAGGSPVTISGLSTTTRRTDRLINLSSLGRITGNDLNRTMIAGLVVSGSGPKPLLLRAVGPGLSTVGVQAFLTNPQLQLFNNKGQVIAQNDDWGNLQTIDAAAVQVGAFKLASSSRDAALLANLEPGAYTVVVSATGGTGYALVEVYDASIQPQADSQQLANISTRGFVEPGDGVMIAGFAIRGNSPKRVLIRGIGPALTAFGVTGALSDPSLKIYQEGAVIAQNDNWETPLALSASQTAASGSEISAANSTAGAFALAPGSKDAAVVLTLAPGNYTGILSAVGTVSGGALIEVYELP